MAMERTELLLLLRKDAKATGLWVPVKEEVKAWAEPATKAKRRKANDFIITLVHEC
jgi:hypothetical protein